MKIVIATPLYPPEIGGPATYCQLLENKLSLTGAEIAIVKFSTVRHLLKIVRHLKYFTLLYKEARRADLIYALDPVSVGLPSLLASLLSFKPLVIKIVGDYAWEQGKQRFAVGDDLDNFSAHWFKYGWAVLVFKIIQTLVAKYSSAVVVPSQYLAKIVTSWGVNPKKIKVIYNAFDLNINLANRDALREKYNLNGFVVMTAGRLVPWKGIKELVESVIILKNLIPELSLIIAGDGPEREALVSLVRLRGAVDYIQFTGELLQPDLFAYIKAADLFVLNSTYEGLSHQLLEVMSLETPIVATDVGGNPEIITTGENGILISPYNSDELQAAILWLAKSQTESDKLKQEAKISLHRFSEKKMIDTLYQHLKTIV
ncbi:MAG: hypothetical protein QG665_417 [Patescibacteria group bacterium]|nr:hypothetical protein [Patescibacteria group bacterium]